jgi:hypothetical protein
MASADGPAADAAAAEPAVVLERVRTAADWAAAGQARAVELDGAAVGPEEQPVKACRPLIYSLSTVATAMASLEKSVCKNQRSPEVKAEVGVEAEPAVKLEPSDDGGRMAAAPARPGARVLQPTWVRSAKRRVVAAGETREPGGVGETVVDAVGFSAPALPALLPGSQRARGAAGSSAGPREQPVAKRPRRATTVAEPPAVGVGRINAEDLGGAAEKTAEAQAAKVAVAEKEVAEKAEFAAVLAHHSRHLHQWRPAGALAEKETAALGVGADAVPLQVLAAVEQLLNRCAGDVCAHASSEQR